jgi:hypothetical protein
MSYLDRVFPKQQPHPAATSPPGPPAAAVAPQQAPAAPLPPGGGLAIAPQDLLERRRALAEELATLQWDLGGLTYEMAIRDHFRLEVLIRQAARLQEVDAQLADVERLLRMEEGGAAGSCPSCGSLHSRGAVFCWQCGTQILDTTPAPQAIHRNGHGPA